MSLQPESVRTVDLSGSSTLISVDELDNVLESIPAAERSSMRQAALRTLGAYVGYYIGDKQITARYPRWALRMELPAPRPDTPYGATLISDIRLSEVTRGAATAINDAAFFTDLDPPPPELVFTGALPVRQNYAGDALPAQIVFKYSSLSAQDSRTQILKHSLLLLLGAMVDERNGAERTSGAWQEAAQTVRRVGL